MYKVLDENKIVGVSEDYPKLLGDYDVVEDTKHTCDDYEQYNGEYLLKEDVPEPTYEEQSEKRAEAYRQEVDPITSQISRLRDEEQTPEIIEKIDELLQKRSDTVKDIQERYPYPSE